MRSVVTASLQASYVPNKIAATVNRRGEVDARKRRGNYTIAMKAGEPRSNHSSRADVVQKRNQNADERKAARSAEWRRLATPASDVVL